MAAFIARLYAFEDSYGYAKDAIAMNASRHFDASLPLSQSRDSRESTIASDDAEATVFPSEGIQLTFTNGPKAAPGFILGKDRDVCDVVLPRLQHIGRRHCCLTFDSESRFILQDFSSYGTIVRYNGKGQEYRRDFTWIIGGSTVSDSI